MPAVESKKAVGASFGDGKSVLKIIEKKDRELVVILDFSQKCFHIFSPSSKKDKRQILSIESMPVEKGLRFYATIARGDHLVMGNVGISCLEPNQIQAFVLQKYEEVRKKNRSFSFKSEYVNVWLPPII